MLSIPLQAGVGHYVFGVSLDGVEYQLELRWNARAESWVLNILDRSGAVILAGRRVSLGVPLTARFRDARLPAGDLVAIDTTSAEHEPVLDDLGTRVALLYIPAAELPLGTVVRG